jgi:hypothetical protein
MLSEEASARSTLSSPPIQKSARVRYKSKKLSLLSPCLLCWALALRKSLLCEYVCRGLWSSLLPLPGARASTWMIDLVDRQSLHWLHRNTSQYIPPLIAQPRGKLPPFRFVASIRLQHYRPASRRSRVIYRRSLHNYMHLLQGQAWASRRLFDVTSFLFRR